MRCSRGFRIIFGVFVLALFSVYFYLRYTTSPHSSDFDSEHAFVYSEVVAALESGQSLEEFYSSDPRYADLYQTDSADAASETETAEVEVTPTPEPTATPEPENALPDVDLTSWEFVLVNADNTISADYEPPEISYVRCTPDESDTSTIRVDSRIEEALTAFADAARAEGLPVYLSSGYRTYSEQSANLQRKLNEGYDYATAITIVAEPDKSEHRTGLAVDITDVYRALKDPDVLKDTETYKWMSQHCQEYGFIVRYPTDESDKLGGIIYEPWHFRYVGVEAATYIMENGLWLEEFLALYDTDAGAADSAAQ